MLLGIVSAVAFATILAVVAGLTLAASASFAHDVYANIIKRGKADRAVRGPGGPADRDRGRRAGASSAASPPNGQNVAFLVALALALAASANLPTMLTRCSGSGSTRPAHC